VARQPYKVDTCGQLPSTAPIASVNFVLVGGLERFVG
jgi:hypothetical protein